MDGQVFPEIRRRLDRIQTLSAEIEAVPNWPQDVWTMKGIDKKCQEIRGHCQWIAAHLPDYDTEP